MFSRTIQWKYLSSAFVGMTIAIVIIFFLPDKAFLEPGRRNSHLTFLGMRAVFGEYLARYFFSLPFVIISIAALKKAFIPDQKRKSYYDDEAKEEYSLGSPHLLGRLRNRRSRRRRTDK